MSNSFVLTAAAIFIVVCATAAQRQPEVDVDSPVPAVCVERCLATGGGRRCVEACSRQLLPAADLIEIIPGASPLTTGDDELASDARYVDNADHDEENAPFQKKGGHHSSVRRGSSFIRIGKSSYDRKDDGAFGGDVAKRAGYFVRIGRAPSEAAKRASSFVRIGRSLEDPRTAALKRMSSFVRIGKSVAKNEEDKRASSFVRIGRMSPKARQETGTIDESLATAIKKASSFVRIGKSEPTGQKVATRGERS